MRTGLESSCAASRSAAAHRPAQRRRRLQPRPHAHARARGHGRPRPLRRGGRAGAHRVARVALAHRLSRRATTSSWLRTRWRYYTRRGPAARVRAGHPRSPSSHRSGSTDARPSPSTSSATTRPATRRATSRVQAYEIPYETSLTVLEGLFHIQEKLDGSLAFRYCCRASICGSCAMYINGRYRLACQTNVLHLHTDEVTRRAAAAPAAGQGPGLRHGPTSSTSTSTCSPGSSALAAAGEGDPPVAGGPPQAQHAHRLHPLRRLLQQLPVGLDRGQLPRARRRCSRRTASRSTRATRPARSACRAGTTSAAPIAATRSPTARRRAPRSSTRPRASSGSRWRPCAGGCSAGEVRRGDRAG